ncbi:hypothetical protein DICPUDRAFT_150903 [Dictyostelium purpureum]|uniref:Uncharacterized protein n=1 Tax=Dictyostelium purpureum TaxID=5786 RepID=F0ZHJ3_DICPU|nr:uncharacterized protein DICPUDRAFT_150903 [Dictyostelium purpureum]EGC36594.1 hypothetical protein DICPUDRAFT_150903 [Dictyostelium purpureum]|eukprot:XP_003286898.1 hypothetical protein DICPUDRAFT_150903 [Dictyostelium purpureum]
MDLAELKRIVEDKISLLAASEAMRKEEKEKSQRDTFIRIDLESQIAVLKKNSERREKKLAELSDENAELKYVIIDNERDIKNLESRVNQLSKSREDQKVSENVVVVENQVNKTISRMKLKNDDIDDICNIICNSTVEKYGERAWFHLNNYGYSKIEEKLEQLTQVVFYNKESCIKFRDITREYIVNNGGQMEWNGYVKYMKDHDNKAERENKLRMSLKEAKGKINIKVRYPIGDVYREDVAKKSVEATVQFKTLDGKMSTEMKFYAINMEHDMVIGLDFLVDSVQSLRIEDPHIIKIFKDADNNKLAHKVKLTLFEKDKKVVDNHSKVVASGSFKDLQVNGRMLMSMKTLRITVTKGAVVNDKVSDHVEKTDKVVSEVAASKVVPKVVDELNKEQLDAKVKEYTDWINNKFKDVLVESLPNFTPPVNWFLL